MTADAPARLRAALDAAAAGPVAPAWDAIRARVEAGAEHEAPLAPPRRVARWLPVAAAVALVAGGVVLAARADEEDPTTDDGVTYCAVLARPVRSGLAVQVTLDPDAGSDDVAAVRTAIEASVAVDRLTYVDRDAAFARAQRLFADQPTILETLMRSDVPTSFAFTVADEAAADEVAADLGGDPAVIDVQDGRRLPSPDVFGALVGLARGDDGPLVGGVIPADAAVVEDLRGSAPPRLAPLAEVAADALAEPLAAGPAAVDAVARLLDTTAGSCGRPLPPPPATATTEAATTTEPG